MHPRFRALPIQLSVDPAKGPDGVPRRVQVLRTGSFMYQDETMSEPVPMNITREMLATMVRNFSEGVRKVDLAMDYSHRSGEEAAGWFTKLFTDTTGEELWAEIDWTPAAADKLSKKEYRYVSADFNFDYQDNETLQSFGPTLNGAGLTNRPFVKNMAPAMALTEGGRMADKKLDDKGGKGEPDADDKMKKMEAELADMKAKYASILDENTTLKASKLKSDADMKAAEQKSKFDRMLSEGKVVEAQREPFMKSDMDGFTSAAKPLNLSEKGHGNDDTGGEGEPKTYGEAVIEIKKRAEKLFSEKKAKTLGECFSLVLKADQKLSQLYYKGGEPKTRVRTA